MGYTVQSSEKLRKSCAEAETKALLYLMNFRPDSDEIHYFVVDFFNDLTGMDRFGTKLWDLQSKNASNVGPKEIGKELVTLFKNYMSDIEFNFFILFVGSVTGAVRIDLDKNTFGISNVKDNAVLLIKAGLVEEGNKKTYINSEWLTDENITPFLAKVLFVIDEKKEKSEYVKGIIQNHPNIIPEKLVLESIFNEIRDKQSSKKNNGVVEGITVETSDEAINYCRHLTNNEIRLLTLQRIIQKNPLEKGITPSFVHIYSAWPPELQKSKLEECQQSLCRALFNQNAADGFWNLFEQTYRLIMENPEKETHVIFQKLTRDQDCLSRCPDFDIESLKYFIAMVKDGIQQ